VGKPGADHPETPPIGGSHGGKGPHYGIKRPQVKGLICWFKGGITRRKGWVKGTQRYSDELSGE